MDSRLRGNDEGTRGAAFWAKPAALFFFLLLVSPHAATAQCTKDTDCKYGRVCEFGSCVSPNQAASGVHPTPPLRRGKAAQKQVACHKKCEHERTKCLAKVGGGDCVAERRAACMHSCLTNYPAATCESENCNPSNPRNTWRADCGGDPAGDCTEANERCRRGCE